MNMKLRFRTRKLFLLAVCLMGWLSISAQAPQILSEKHAMLRLTPQSRYLLLPIQEREENANISIIVNGQQVKSLNAKLAVDKVDYYVPLDLTALNTKTSTPNSLLLDITFHGDRRATGAMKGYVCWKEMKQSDTFDTANREKFRPQYHHTPAYGWMNDPNGMFYKDGVWHLYYQWNPYGSQWENMTWGHSTSRDLAHWEAEPTAIEPDALGAIFSGSAVVDKDNTAGFGKGAVIAMYTSAGQAQTQSIAYSNDGGRTFTKYEGNPVITFEAPDFRDPKVFWHEQTKRWIVVLAAGQEVQFYSSPDLKHWTYESSFGREYGNHDGVWECPDLLCLDAGSKHFTGRGGEAGKNMEKGLFSDDVAYGKKWVLLLNINPGGPFGGSATQYFVGEFDGHKFTCEDEPKETKWMDYGKDHYATVTFSNAPENRTVALAWMSNWQYAGVVPTQQFRSANSIPRDLKLMQLDGETYLVSTPSKEMLALRGKAVKKGSASGKKVVKNLLKQNTGAYELTATFDMQKAEQAQVTLYNTKGEEFTIGFDTKKKEYYVDRTKSGQTAFSDDFASVTRAPLPDVGTYQLRVFVDNSSVEVFIDPGFGFSGLFPMTNLVFPTEPYNNLRVEGRGKLQDITVYPIN